MKSKIFLKVTRALAAVGPGLFLIGYNIGTGSVTTMAKSGAEHGMSLFWALVLSCIFTYILMVAYGQITLVTGRTSLFNFKTHFKFGNVLALYIMAAMIVGELMALMGIMGIVSDLLKEATRILFGGEGVGTLWITIVLVIGLYVLLWYGRYPSFEKMLTFFVLQMGICFVIVFFMVKPDFSAILRGLVPSVPRVPGAMGLIAAMAGTTCSAAVFIMRSIVVAEKGWTSEHLKLEKKDSFVSAGMMLFLSAVIMAVSAGTLHVMGLRLNETVEMISLFAPLGGKAAALILILGITGAGLSTVFPIILIAPWLVCDYTGKPRNIRSPLFRILGFTGLLFAFGLQILRHSPPAMMIFSQAFQACILPAVVVPVIILLNRESVMQSHRAGKWMNIGLYLVLLFSLLTSYFAIAELF